MGNNEDINEKFDNASGQTDYSKYRYYQAEEDIYTDFRIKNIEKIETLSEGVAENKPIPLVGKYTISEKKKSQNGYKLTKKIPVGSLDNEIEKLNYIQKNENKYDCQLKNNIKDNLFDVKNLNADTDGYEDFIYSEIDLNDYDESYKNIDDERSSVSKKYDYLKDLNQCNPYSKLKDGTKNEKNIKKNISKDGGNKTINKNILNNEDKDTDKRKKKKFRKSKKNNTAKHNGGGIIIGFIIFAIFIITFFLCNFYMPNSWYDSMVSGEITMYAVGKYAINNDDYKNIQDLYVAKGGAGYGYIKDNKIFVIADIYDNKEDADSVINNENNKGAIKSITELKIREYSFDKVESNLVMTTTSALNYINVCFYKLRGIAISLSQKEMDTVEAKSRIEKLTNELKNIKQFYDDNSYGSSNDKVLKLKAQIGVCYKYLVDLKEQNNLPHAIRNTYTTILLLHIEIIEDSYN